LLPLALVLANSAFVLCSCRDHAAAISSEQTAPSSSALAVDAASLNLDAAIYTSDASDTSLGASFDAGPLIAPVKIADPARWMAARGVQVAPLENYGNKWGCVEIAVGTARELALVCSEVKDVSRGAMATPDSVYRVVEHRIVRVVRAGSVVTVLDAEITLEPLDKETVTQGYLLDLRFRVAPDGMSVTVDDHGPGAHCPSAKYLNDKSSCKTGDVWTRFDCEQWFRMCNARGGYVWQGDRFVRDPNWIDPTPPTTKAATAPTSTMRTGSSWDRRSGGGSH